MVNLNICIKCSHCVKYSRSKLDGDGRLERGPLVDCDLDGVLFYSSNVPQGCPYALEQKLTEDDAENDQEIIKEEIRCTSPT